jgi:hypothetical protein
MNTKKLSVYKSVKSVLILILFALLFLVANSVRLNAQNSDTTKSSVSAPPDTSKNTSPATTVATKDTVKNTTPVKTLTKDDFDDMGVAVSPSSMHLNIKPGNSTTREVSVTNDTKKSVKFNIGFSDFVMGENGKPNPSPSTSKFAFSKWITITPTYFELKPGEKRKIKLLITIPDTAFYSAWTILTIDKALDKKPMDLQGDEKTINFGIFNSIGFGVFLYQNPPNVKVNNVEIQKFSLETNGQNKKEFIMDLKNTGDGIGYSTAYIDLTNINTGKITKVKPKKFTILPQYRRVLKFEMPANMETGKYSGVGVLDFGSKDEIKAAELDFEIN